MNFLDYQNAKGHLEIWKHYPDGNRELHWEEKNVITSGMGVTLSRLFDANPTDNVEDYQITLFKVGVSGNDVTTAGQTGALQVSTTGDVSAALTLAQYGDGNLDLSVHNLYKNAVVDESDHVFGVVPYSYIKRVSETKCIWQIVLDEQTANIAGDTPGPGNATALNEIGIYSNNPFQKSTKASALCAYRYYKPIYKTDAFIVVFRWTIEF